MEEVVCQRARKEITEDFLGQSKSNTLTLLTILSKEPELYGINL